MTPMGVCRHVLVVAPPQPLPIDRAPIGGDQEILIPPRVDSTPSPMPRSGAFRWQVEDRCDGSCQEPWWWLHKRVNLGQTRGIGGIDRRIFWMMGKTVGACVGGPSEQCGARRTGVARPRKAVRVSGGRQQAAPVGSAPCATTLPACLRTPRPYWNWSAGTGERELPAPNPGPGGRLPPAHGSRPRRDGHPQAGRLEHGAHGSTESRTGCVHRPAAEQDRTPPLDSGRCPALIATWRLP